MSNTIFDKIARGEMSAFVVWEDDNYMAFLTPFPNTPGFTVVIPKKNLGDNIFALNDEDYTKLQLAVKKVAKLLEKALGVSRVALIYEGTGVAYVHAKLIPLHGELVVGADVSNERTEFVEEYRGFITTLGGPKMADEKLAEIQAKIREAAE
jgi:diadenosine tetraphosphate (Ap4A) HIT family hydrolase